MHQQRCLLPCPPLTGLALPSSSGVLGILGVPATGVSGGQPVPHKGKYPQGPVSRRDFRKPSLKGLTEAKFCGGWPQAPHQVPRVTAGFPQR